MNKRFEKKYGRKFARFVEYLLADGEDSETAVRLQREGVDLLRMFGWLRVYVNAEGRSIAPERKKRGKSDRAIVNKGVREYGLTPEVGRWLQNRMELAHSVNGVSRVHNVDALAAAHIYLKLCTHRQVTIRELGVLVEATNYALDQKPVIVDSQTIGRALQRHRQNHPEFLKLLKEDIARTIYDRVRKSGEATVPLDF